MLSENLLAHLALKFQTPLRTVLDSIKISANLQFWNQEFCSWKAVLANVFKLAEARYSLPAAVMLNPSPISVKLPAVYSSLGGRRGVQNYEEILYHCTALCASHTLRRRKNSFGRKTPPWAILCISCHSSFQEDVTGWEHLFERKCRKLMEL